MFDKKILGERDIFNANPALPGNKLDNFVKKIETHVRNQAAVKGGSQSGNVNTKGFLTGEILKIFLCLEGVLYLFYSDIAKAG